MDMLLALKFLAAFVFVISLMMLLSFFVKKLGLSSHVNDSGAKRRLSVVEHISLDHRRRLVLVRCDDREHLLVMGSNGETVVETSISITEKNTGIKEVKHA